MNLQLAIAHAQCRFMRINIAYHQAALLTLLALFSPGAFAGWERQWIDPFDGNAVNWDNWTAQVQANFNAEVQCYTDDDSSADQNFDVSGGTLKIIARRQTVNCAGLNGQERDWTSGRLNSKDKREFLYGRIESRIRFLNLEGGTWPAFWMLENRIAEDPVANDGDSISWPNPGAGEIDVWEWYSNNAGSYITNFFNTGGCGGETRHNYPFGSADVNNWHTYAIEWTADSISFFRDDTLVTTHDMTNCNQYEEPMFVLLNLAIGGTLGGSIDSNLMTATLEIDYVAHCTPSSANNAQLCDESTPSYLDDDNDGVSNDNDLCLNTAPGVSVNGAGCALVSGENHAPGVSLIISQGGEQTSTIDPDGGQVVITASIVDEDTTDSHTLVWNIPGISGASETGTTLSFSPVNLSEGSYSVSLEVSDDGSPPLQNNTSTTFSVVSAHDPITRFPSGGSSGAVDIIWLLILSICMLPVRACQNASKKV